MGRMAVDIRWADGEMQTVVAAIDEGAPPVLEPGIAGAIRAAAPPAHGATWTVQLEFADGQRLKAWCEARRERATEEEPDETWTRIVARVNEAVQPLAPARDPVTGQELPPR
jgi:hypothetical protein